MALLEILTMPGPLRSDNYFVVCIYKQLIFLNTLTYCHIMALTDIYVENREATFDIIGIISKAEFKNI